MSEDIDFLEPDFVSFQMLFSLPEIWNDIQNISSLYIDWGSKVYLQAGCLELRMHFAIKTIL